MDETINNLRQFAKGLIDNIVRFSDLLRENGVSVNLPAVLDAIRGLPLIEISNRAAFQCLLRVNLLHRKEDIAKFDKLFDAYWLPKYRTKQKIPPEDSLNTEEQDIITILINKKTDFKAQGANATLKARQWLLGYSPDSVSKMGEWQELRFAESKACYEFIVKLLQPLTNRISRRLKYTIRGKEISLKKILRKNIQFGGELIVLDYKKKKLKKRRLIFLCDVSGSMDTYTLMILQFIHALKRIDRRTEIFFFSTDLTRGTTQFNTGDFVSALSGLPEVVADWCGGTRIGHCLKRFNGSYGKWLLSKNSIVMIFSDGWDRGEIDVLETQMAFLKRKVYKIIWLNPLLGTRDYQPICQGMSAALPYVDYFFPMSNPHDLQFLGRTLEKMIT